MTNIKYADYNAVANGFIDMDMEEAQMKNRKKGLKKIKDSKIDIWWSKLSHKHPLVAFMMFIVGLPTCSLLAVASSVMLFIMPLALLLGWL